MGAESPEDAHTAEAIYGRIRLILGGIAPVEAVGFIELQRIRAI